MKKLLCYFSLLALTACGTAGQQPTAVKVGKPYSVEGQMYYPEQDDGYDEEGIASWYGPGFHGKLTANGEKFDTEDFTAAHPTLPMPSFVKVTNLENGKEVIVRINDRGPFKKGRIIDLSRAAAKQVDIHGLQKVRVTYLKDKTEQYWAQNKLKTNDIRFSKNSPIAKPDMTQMAETSSDEVSAPILSVSENELAPATNKKTANVAKPKFSLISSAEAAERPMPVENSNIQQMVDDGKGKEEDPSGDAMKPLVDAPTPRFYEPEKSPTPVNTRGGYYVQAGAFSREENANGFAGRLASVGATSVVPTQTAKGTLYRVLIGPEPSRGEAQKLKEKLSTFGVNDARVVVQ